MTREEMLALLDRRIRGWQERDPEALAADYAETAVLDSPISGHAVGREEIRRAYEAFLKVAGLIGAGSMGEVHQARDTKLDCDVVAGELQFQGVWR